MAKAGYSFETDMANFVRENLRDHQQVRSKGTPAFSDPPLVTQTTTILKDSPLPAPVRTAIGGSLLGGSSHPWEVVPNGDDTVTVAAGVMFKVTTRDPTPGVDGHAWDYVWEPIEFDGISLLALTGTQYIYASIELQSYRTDGLLSITHNPDGIANGSESYVYGLTGAISVYASTNAPAVEGADQTTGVWIVPIAKVTVTDGVASVDKQYLTHNPSMQLGYFTMQP